MSGEAPLATCPRCRATYPSGRFGLCPRCLLGDERPGGPGTPRPLGDAIELLEVIGRGGMGTVYRGRDRRLERTVAVKLLADHLAEDPDFRRRFDREARALARLSHPNVVGIHGVGEADGQPYIVMEHVAGRPLSAHLPLPIGRALQVALDVSSALAYAHGQGIVHRDIKPQNVLVGPDGRAKVTDFGIARLLATDDTSWTVTGTGEALGTPRFAAPEVLRGAAPDPRQDVYSLGALLYAMVRGEAPAGEFEPLPGGLDRIVRRALAADPRRRYGTVDEMRRDLASLSVAAETDADADALSLDERNWPRAVALLLAVATAGWLWALLVSIAPRVVDPREMGPLVMVAPEPLPDGRVVSWARFETGPILGAAGLSVLALAGYGLLRRHWRHAGLEVRRPERALPQTRAVLVLGGLSVGLYAVRKTVQLIAHAPFVPYVPVVGGLIELAVLFFVWSSILEAWRTGRSLARERLLWLGLGLAVAPPVTDFLLYVRAWRP